jgi:hypothetical protein
MLFFCLLDTIYCGGDCLATGTEQASIPAGVSKAFPHASAFEAYIQPNTGHGINFHYNCEFWFFASLFFLYLL